MTWRILALLTMTTTAPVSLFGQGSSTPTRVRVTTSCAEVYDETLGRRRMACDRAIGTLETATPDSLLLVIRNASRWFGWGDVDRLEVQTRPGNRSKAVKIGLLAGAAGGVVFGVFATNRLCQVQSGCGVVLVIPSLVAGTAIGGAFGLMVGRGPVWEERPVPWLAGVPPNRRIGLHLRW